MSLGAVLQKQNQRLDELRDARHFTHGFSAIFFRFLLQIKCKVQRSKSLNDVNHETLEHLSNHLIWALDQHLHWPPWLLRHMLKKPFACLLTRVKLFRKQLNPKHHRWLVEKMFVN